MAISNRINFRGGQNVAPTNILYENGVWNVGYNNPSPYTYSGVNVAGAVMGAQEITLNSSSVTVDLFGTDGLIDLSNKRNLRITTKNGGSMFLLRIASTKETSSPAVKQWNLAYAGDYTEQVFDVSDLTGSYYISVWSLTNGGYSLNVNKISLD